MNGHEPVIITTTYKGGKRVDTEAMLNTQTREVYNIEKKHIGRDHKFTGETYITLLNGDEFDVEERDGKYFAKK